MEQATWERHRGREYPGSLSIISIDSSCKFGAESVLNRKAIKKNECVRCEQGRVPRLVVLCDTAGFDVSRLIGGRTVWDAHVSSGSVYATSFQHAAWTVIACGYRQGSAVYVLIVP